MSDGGEGREERERGKLKGKGEGKREEDKGEREVKYSSPVATVHLGLLALSVVQETGWHQGAQRDKCSGRRSLHQSLRTLCQDTVSCMSKMQCVVEFCLMPKYCKCGFAAN